MIQLTSLLETEFHRDLASPAWLEQLTAHVETAIRAIAGFETCEGIGKVHSQHNETRYMGPNSIVRYRFIVDVVVLRAKPDAEGDLYQCHVRFRPESNGFETQSETVDNQETRNRKREEAERRSYAIENVVQRLRQKYEGQEAVHVEQGALRVRVTGIRTIADRVVAEVQEVPTAGLQNSLLHRAHGGHPGPLQWQVHAFLGEFMPESAWVAHIAHHWGLLFDPEIVQGLTDLAARWHDELPALARHCEIGCFLLKRGAAGSNLGQAST